MSRLRAGLGAAVCILVFGMVPARAQDPVDDSPKPRRPVAVIELGDFDGNRRLAEQIAVELNNHAELKPIDSSVADDALREPYVDEDAGAIDLALAAKRRAEDNVSGYKFPEAASEADSGLRHLHLAVPSPRVVALASELAFLLGAARLGERKSQLATAAFRLARSLEPGFSPDAIRYLPEVVSAFESAVRITSVTPPMGKIAVGPGEGRVFLDGREVGNAPQWFDATAGLHVVWLVGPERDTYAQRVSVIAGQKVQADFEPMQIDTKKRILRARLALKTAPDPAARAAAMQHLAKLVEVKDALLLGEANGITIVQTWRDEAPGFSALREKGKDEKPVDLLAPIAPPKPIPTRRDPPPCPAGTSRLTPNGPCTPVITATPLAWYERPRYQIAGGAVGAMLIGVAIFAIASWDRSMQSNPKAGFEQVQR